MPMAMAGQTTETLVGAAVLAAAVGFLGFAAQFTDFTATSSDVSLTASFRSIEGVGVGTDVRMVGVKIGTVSDVTLDTDTYRATAVLTLDSDVPVPDDSAAIVSSEGLLGGSFIEILPGASFDYYVDGDQILDTQGSVSLIDLLLKFIAGGSEGDQ